MQNVCYTCKLKRKFVRVKARKFSVYFYIQGRDVSFICPKFCPTNYIKGCIMNIEIKYY